MKFTAEQIAGILEGEVVGNPMAEVFRLSKIEEGTEGSLTFLSNPKYLNYIYTTKASVTIVNDTFVPESQLTTTLIKVQDAYASFSKLLEFYNQVKLNKTGIEQPSFISQSAKYGDNLYLGSFSYIGQNVVLGENVKIYPNCFLGDNVVVGDNVILFAGAKIYSETVIGNNCIIHSGAIIGADGFGFAPNQDGTFTKIPQIGNVIIEDNVDIGSCTTIDRATMGSTIIRKGVKLDNQIQIGHNVRIGAHTAIAGCAAVAGSTTIGRHCRIGGGVGIVGHVTIGDGVTVTARTLVTKSIPQAGVYSGGLPHMGNREWLKTTAHVRRMEQLLRRVKQLEREIKNIEGRTA